MDIPKSSPVLHGLDEAAEPKAREPRAASREPRAGRVSGRKTGTANQNVASVDANGYIQPFPRGSEGPLVPPEDGFWGLKRGLSTSLEATWTLWVLGCSKNKLHRNI